MDPTNLHRQKQQQGEKHCLSEVVILECFMSTKCTTQGSHTELFSFKPHWRTERKSFWIQNIIHDLKRLY